ncbi:hypothetical protein R3W88_016803 [Solanum pinnatisectum]|uniref:Reticulon-like protein n=1 Tax=Solanum pinnatisectum TaxID=50273 RepID=A0AAV9KYD2_9SOLN|nr:hypothetical protein R3W88_016803 [Solanum pinnatisectum]
MADHAGENDSFVDSVMDKVNDKLHNHDSSSDSDDDKGKKSPVNAKVTAGVLGFATVIWALFELLEYHLLTLVCHILIVAVAVLFLWSNASTFINTYVYFKVVLPKDIVLGVASALRIEINQALEILWDIASGKDLKKFLVVIVGLWLVSILGNIWNFLTLFYIVFVLLHTVPLLYEKYEDKVDAFAEKADA